MRIAPPWLQQHWEEKPHKQTRADPGRLRFVSEVASHIGRNFESSYFTAIQQIPYVTQSGQEGGFLPCEGFVEETVRDIVLPNSETCPLEDEHTNQQDFFPPCLHLALAVTTILPDAELASWTSTLPLTGIGLAPLVDPVGAHAGGLNFSRSWGLLALHEHTGEAAWRRSAVSSSHPSLSLNMIASQHTKSSVWPEPVLANYAG